MGQQTPFTYAVRAYFERCGAGAASPDHLRIEVYRTLMRRYPRTRVLRHFDRISRVLVRIEHECREQAPCKPSDLVKEAR